MPYLCIDTSSPSTLLALGEEGRVVQSAHLPKGDHAQNLLDGIEDLLGQASMKLSDMGGYALVNGPGSFTGLRIGLATLKGFALVFPKPVVALHALELLSEQAPRDLSVAAPCIHSRKGKVYVGVYRAGTRESFLSPKECHPKEIFAIHPEAHFFGSALERQPDLFIDLPLAPTALSSPTPDQVCLSAWKKIQSNDFRNIETLEPDYVVSSVASMYKPGP